MERFWKKVKKAGPNECWEWQAGKFKAGYGAFSYKGQPVCAHRVSWELSYGRIKKGLHVLHKCDNPSCVNPNHLFLGSHLDNIKDMVSKNRQKVIVKNLRKALPGESHYFSKLKWSDVRQIRNKYNQGIVSQKALAKEYGVIQQTISLIVSGKNWKE